MSVSQIEGLAIAVADDLSNVCSAWPESFNVRYEPDPDVNLTELSTTFAFVRDEEARIVNPFASRSMSEWEYDIAVGVWKKVSSSKSQTVSNLKYIGQEIAKTFRFLGDKNKWPTGRLERLKRVDSITAFEDAKAQELGAIKLRVLLVFNGWSE